MQFICDFHIHSRFARATSRQINFKNLDLWAKIKGLRILGTGDFTHPIWLKEIEENLEEAEPGLFKLKNQKTKVRFILTSEISCIYQKNDGVKKVHLILFAPDIQSVKEINKEFSKFTNLKIDGRPIINLDAKEVLRIISVANPNIYVACAHIWTPWFSIFGSRSGFNSIEECFEELTPKIFALETGLSANPEMCWRVSDIDNFPLISNSDSHSLSKIGREANVFEIDEKNLSFNEIIKTIKSQDKNRFLFTIEFFPEEGKYHFDGHRQCNISLNPQESQKYGGICPICLRPLTIGVLSRVEDLADRPIGDKPEKFIPFKSLVPLEEIISESLGVRSTNSKKVSDIYNNLIKYFENEFNILLSVPIEKIENLGFKEIAQGIKNLREGNVSVIPGFDGEYGKISVFPQKNAEKIREARKIQKRLF
ncbi:MAG: endonuclease Q family protein [Candidatus Pacebacteria bacterium]|nr:endonuclease Q family protein [Candidatus Paceibacterota bacterium]